MIPICTESIRAFLGLPLPPLLLATITKRAEFQKPPCLSRVIFAPFGGKALEKRINKGFPSMPKETSTQATAQANVDSAMEIRH